MHSSRHRTNRATSTSAPGFMFYLLMQTNQIYSTIHEHSVNKPYHKSTPHVANLSSHATTYTRGTSDSLPLSMILTFVHTHIRLHNTELHFPHGIHIIDTVFNFTLIF